MANNEVRLDLLLKEIKDEYVQENFRKLKKYLDGIELKITGGTGSGNTTIINNTTTVDPTELQEQILGSILIEVDYLTDPPTTSVQTDEENVLYAELE